MRSAAGEPPRVSAAGNPRRREIVCDVVLSRSSGKSCASIHDHLGEFETPGIHIRASRALPDERNDPDEGRDDRSGAPRIKPSGEALDFAVISGSAVGDLH